MSQFIHFIKTVGSIVSLPFLLLTIHWASVRFYANYCVPDTLTGYISSYLTTANPVCVFCLTMMDKTNSLYLSSWVFLTIGLVNQVTGYHKYITTSKKN